MRERGEEDYVVGRGEDLSCESDTNFLKQDFQTRGEQVQDSSA